MHFCGATSKPAPEIPRKGKVYTYLPVFLIILRSWLRDLIDELSRASEGRLVSRPTVYRTLRELVDAGLLRQMTLSGRAVYEHDYGYPSHDHLHCQKCDSLIEFSNEEFGRIRDAVAKEHGFRVTGHRLIISGICAECAKRGRRKRPLDLI